MQVKFTQPPDVGALRSTLDQAGITGAEIQQFGTNLDYTIRARDAKQVESQAAGAEGISKQIEAALTNEVRRRSVTIGRTEAVGPKVGSELRSGAIKAMLLASLFTLIYLAIRFDWRFGLSAVLSTTHDIWSRSRSSSCFTRGVADRGRGHPHATRLFGQRHDHHF